MLVFLLLVLGVSCILPVCSGLPFKLPFSNIFLCFCLSKKKTYHFKVCLGCVASLNLVVVSLKAPCRSGHHLLIMSLFYHVLEHLMFCSGYYPLLRVLVSLSGEFF